MERWRTVSAFGCWLEGLCQHSSPGLMTHRVQDTDQEARPLVLSRDEMLVELDGLLYEQVSSSVTKVYKQERRWSETEM